MRKRWVAVGAVLAVVLFVAASILSEYGASDPNAVKLNAEYIEACQSPDDTDWEELDKSGTIVLENTGYRLEMDAATTYFSITDKNTGATYRSYQTEEMNWGSEDVRRRASSNIAVMYYGDDYVESYMGSGEDAVEAGQYTIKRNGETLRVTYVLGSATQDVFAPYIIPQDVFEERLLPQITSNSDKRSMRRYYKLYTEEERPSDYAEVIKKYPFLKKVPCYVLTRTTENIIQEVTEYVRETDYTEEEYEAFRDQYEFEDPGMSVPVGYTIPLELSLQEDGFSARILSDRIRVHNEDYPLCDLFLLEFFDCTDTTSTGSYLVPDGSGALIPFNQNGQTTYIQKLYGEDYSQAVEVQQQLSRNATMPILGKLSDAGNYLMIVEGGAEAASVNVQTAGALSPVNKGYMTFQMTTAVQTSLGDRRGMSNYILYSDHILYENPQIRYVFTAGSNSVAGLADVYRNYLFEADVLTYDHAEQEMPLYLDFLCMTTTQEEFLGIPYTKKWVLSPLTEIITVVQELQEAGIRNIRVRLRGWTAGGLRHGAVDKGKIDASVGTAEQLKQLSDLLSATGGRLYLDADFTFSYQNRAFDSFKKARDSVKQMERNVAIFPKFDLVTLQATDKYQNGYMVSPETYPLYASRFLASLAEQSDFGDIGLSWSSSGQYVHSDFQTDGHIDRCQSAHYIRAVLEQMAQSASSLMTDYGNGYTWRYVDDIVGMPSDCSRFVPESQSVAFLQMVLSGGINYAGQPLNIDQSQQTRANLYSNLSAPYFVLITADNRLLEKADLHDQYYSLHMQNSYLIETYQSMCETLQGCYGERIQGYRWISESVTETVLENGTVLIVNHSENEVQTDAGKLMGYDVRVTRQEARG